MNRIERILEKHARQITLLLSQADGRTLTQPRERGSKYIRVKVYRKTNAHRARGEMQSLKRELTALGFAPKGRLAENDYAWWTTAIYAKAGLMGKSVTNRVRTIARDLSYADQKRVPTKYLIGWIHQVGGSKGIERLYATKEVSVPSAGDEKLEKGNSAESERRALKRESRRSRLELTRLQSSRRKKTKRRGRSAK